MGPVKMQPCKSSQNTEAVNTDLIQWPRAKFWTTQWNTWIGCVKCSPACQNCWAEAWAKRFHQSFEPHKTKQDHPPRHGICFCGNLSDLFGNFVEEEEADILGKTADAARNSKSTAQYLWLTKRPENMKRVLEHWSGALQRPQVWFERNWWGFTAENQEMFDKRSKCANAFPDWANLWMSAEPLLEHIELRGDICKRLKCVIVGCESGPNRRPCNIEWVEDVVNQCLALDIPVFVKQISINGKCVTDITKFPKHLQIRQLPWAKAVKRD